MIGLALVTLVAVLGQGIRSTFTDAVDRIFVADYAITAQNNFSPIPIEAAEAAAGAPGVRGGGERPHGRGARLRRAFVRHRRHAEQRQAPSTWSGRRALRRSSPSSATNGAFVDDGFADDHNLTVGSPISITTPAGKQLDLTVKGIFDPPAGGSPVRQRHVLERDVRRRTTTSRRTSTRSCEADGGVTDANTQSLDNALADFPNAKAQTREEFKDNQVSFLNNILNILYVLLALSVVVSLFGIVNTLVLTVFERTRELGMLRAIGMTRRQVRRMIRYESVITALIGAVLGIILGDRPRGPARLARGLHRLLRAHRPAHHLRRSPPIIVGIIAAIFPARRAARLNPLQALQYE